MLGREWEGIWREELRACANQVPNSSRTKKSLVHMSTLRSQAEGRAGQLQKQLSDSHSSAHDYMEKPVRILGSWSPIHVQYRRLSGLVSPSLRFHTDKLKLPKALAVQQRAGGGSQWLFRNEFNRSNNGNRNQDVWQPTVLNHLFPVGCLFLRRDHFHRNPAF